MIVANEEDSRAAGDGDEGGLAETFAFAPLGRPCPLTGLGELTVSLPPLLGSEEFDEEPGLKLKRPSISLLMFSCSVLKSSMLKSRWRLPVLLLK